MVSGRGERVRAEQEDAADDVMRQVRADPDRVAAQEIALERAKLIVRDAHCREIAEARVHSVHRVVTLGHARDDLGRLLHRSLGRAVEADSDVAPRHLDHIRDREVVTREAEGRYFTFSR